MNKIYGYCRVSTKHQRLDRQVSNIKDKFPTAIIISEKYTGTTTERPQWSKLCKIVNEGDTIIMDSVSRMSRNALEGFKDYQTLFNLGIDLQFLKEPHINTSVYKQSINNCLHLDIATGNKAIDNYFSGNIELINKLLMQLAEQQIILAFEQSEKEVNDLHTRISEGMRESAKKGVKLGLNKGTKLQTKKSLICKEIISKHSKSFGGTLSDNEVIKLCSCTRNSYYKYKQELLEK